MPGGDRTGPQGLGPLTGRGQGYCSGSPVPGYANGPRVGGYGRGLGRGNGRGYGMGYGRGYGPGRGQGGIWQVPYNAPLQPNYMAVPPPQFAPSLSKEEVVSNLELQKKQMQTYIDQLNKEIEQVNKQE